MWQLGTKRDKSLLSLKNNSVKICCILELQQRSFSKVFSSLYSGSIQDGSAETGYAPSPHDASTWHDAPTHGNATSR